MTKDNEKKKEKTNLSERKEKNDEKRQRQIELSYENLV